MFEIESGLNNYKIYNDDRSEKVYVILEENHISVQFAEQMPGHYLNKCLYLNKCHSAFWLESLIKDKEFREIYCEGPFEKVIKYKDTIARLVRLHYSSFR